MNVRSDVQQRLLPGRFWPVAVLIICGCTAVTAVLGIMFAHGTTGSALDNDVQNLVEGSGAGYFGPPGRGPFFRTLVQFSQIGSTSVLTVLTAFLTYCNVALRRYRGAVLLGASVIVASVVSELILMPLVDRTRYGSLSYPSGHDTATFAIATAIVILL